MRRILRLELIAVAPFYSIEDIRIGEKKGSRYFIPFRGVQPNQEGIEVKGGADMYADINKFDWKVRPPQFDDLEEDDDDLANVSLTSTPRLTTPRLTSPLGRSPPARCHSLSDLKDESSTEQPTPFASPPQGKLTRRVSDQGRRGGGGAGGELNGEGSPLKGEELGVRFKHKLSARGWEKLGVKPEEQDWEKLEQQLGVKAGEKLGEKLGQRGEKLGEKFWETPGEVGETPGEKVEERAVDEVQRGRERPVVPKPVLSEREKAYERAGLVPKSGLCRMTGKLKRSGSSDNLNGCPRPVRRASPSLRAGR